MDEDVANKPKLTKPKPKRPIFILHNNNDDVQVQSSLNNLVVIGHFSSNIEEILLSQSGKKISSYF
jgi:hypothetical protein